MPVTPTFFTPEHTPFDASRRQSLAQMHAMPLPLAQYPRRWASPMAVSPDTLWPNHPTPGSVSQSLPHTSSLETYGSYPLEERDSPADDTPNTWRPAAYPFSNALYDVDQDAVFPAPPELCSASTSTASLTQSSMEDLYSERSAGVFMAPSAPSWQGDFMSPPATGTTNASKEAFSESSPGYLDESVGLWAPGSPP